MHKTAGKLNGAENANPADLWFGGAAADSNQIFFFSNYIFL